MKIKNKSIKIKPIEKKLVKNKLVTSKPIKNKSVRNKLVTSNPTRGKLIKSKLNKLNRSKSIVSKLIKRKSRSASSYRTPQSLANEDFFRMGACALVCFKKLVYRPVRAYNGRIQPSLNRRKHAHSHMMILDHQIRQLSKTFNYIKIKTIKFWSAQSMLINYANWYTLNPFQKSGNNITTNLSSLVNFSSLPTKNLVKIIDMFPKSLVWKNAYSKSVIDVFTLHG
jgi:hypothetical protein